MRMQLYALYIAGLSIRIAYPQNSRCARKRLIHNHLGIHNLSV